LEKKVDWTYPHISGIFYVAAFVSAYIAYQAWHRRGAPAVAALCLLLCAIVEWSFFSAISLGASDLGTKVMYEKLASLGAICAPSLFFVFVIEYLEPPGWLTWSKAVFLAVFPVIALVIAWTNDMHGLVWTGAALDPQIPGLIILGRGPAFYFIAVYDYLIALMGLTMLVKAWVSDPKNRPSRLNLIVVSAFFPIAAGIMDIASVQILPGVSLSPVAFTLSGIILAYGIFRIQIFVILPMARDLMIENMRDGVLVLDSRDRVVDINRSAQKIIGISAVDIIGRPASRLPDEWPAAVMQGDDRPTIRKEVRIQQPIPLFLDLQITPIYMRSKKIRGRLIVFRDNTARRKSELELAHRAEEFLVINRINTIITSGLDLDHVLKILHEQCSAVIPSDVFYVALYDEASDLIHLPLYFEKEYQTHAPRDLHKQPGLTGYIIETARTLYTPDVLQPNAAIPPLIRMGGDPTRSYIGIPLILREKVIGVMSVQSYEPNAYIPGQVRMLEAVAVQAAIAIENARLYGEVQRLAIVDELTGVYNFRGLQELGRREVERARRFTRPLTALFFDIDGFRNFNNVYSHATGNIVLEIVSERCRSVLRSVDILARYGGDEFVILLPETDVDMALVTARRLREEVAATKVKTKFGELSVTISLGVATLLENTPNISALIDRANRAEHRAKEKGNSVEIES
jgi:diguanylate cyclase (GGDEF)-like protein/PAS domain S-box-containing protein